MGLFSKNNKGKITKKYSSMHDFQRIIFQKNVIFLIFAIPAQQNQPIFAQKSKTIFNSNAALHDYSHMLIAQNIYNPLRCMPIPECGYMSFFPFAGIEFLEGRRNGGGTSANEFVRTYRTRFRAFGIVAKRDARHAQYCSLFGDAARVCNHSPTMRY